jgi:GNAT superfamily N-acetyltransferase
MIQLLNADVDDTDAILAAKVDAWADEVRLYGRGPENYDSREMFIGLFGTHRVFKIVLDGAIIGGITCVNTGDNVYYIGSVFVKKGYQDRKAGTRAMEMLFDAIPEAVLWKLNTPHRSEKNHHFYEKLGFIKTGETKPDETGFYLFNYEKRMRQAQSL